MNEIQPVENKAVEVKSQGLSGLGTLEDMKKKLQENKEKREFIKQFIRDNLKENNHFGPGTGASGAKPTLLLPGAEELSLNFNIHPEWEVDWDTFKMLGEPEKTICYKCFIVDNATGRTIGEGRGACVVGEKAHGIIARDTNGSIKIAKKRSFVDGVKNALGLSEFFTQDMEMIKSFITEKQALFDYVTKQRAGVNSDLSNKEFLSKVCWTELHKKSISTMNELKIVVESIESYDYETGEKLPEEVR